jgi:hypothetical protein
MALIPPHSYQTRPYRVGNRQSDALHAGDRWHSATKADSHKMVDALTKDRAPPDGLYFQLDEATYHAIPALSASGIKNLLISNPDFWFRSPFNPNRKDENTEARVIGKAFHKRILEGKEAFYDNYAAIFEAPAGCLRTVDDIKEAITEHGEKPKGKVKADLIEQVLTLQPNASIFDELRADYELLHHGKEFLYGELLDSIEISAAMIEKNPHLSKCFGGGYPEVSVIWTEDGVRFKARFDYLKTKAVIDLKTFGNFLNKPIDSAIYSAMASGKYHIQAAFYLRAVEKAKQLAKELKYVVTTACRPDVEDWIKQFRDYAEHDFYFVFQAKGIAPLARGKKFLRGSLWSCGEVAIDEAIRRYKHCMEKHGPDEPWVDDTAIDEFLDDHFPPWTTEL